MEHLTGGNIRAGLDLDVPLSDVFKLEIIKKGDQRLKQLYESSSKSKFLQQNKDLIKLILDEEVVIFKDTKEVIHLCEGLDVYVYHEYIAYMDETQPNSIVCNQNTELEFTNNQEVDFENFCINLMIAQSFSGNFKQPQPGLSYPFIGLGNFSLKEIINSYTIISATNFNMDYFFIYYKGILTSISNIVYGTIEKDIRAQKKYFADSEYKKLLKNARSLKKEMDFISENDDLDENNETSILKKNKQ